MHCLKCGRELDAEQVFCNDCLAEMEKYPVNPGTTLQLPRRRETTSVKKSYFRRKSLSFEEQVKQLRSLVRVLVILLIVVTVIASLLAYPAVTHMMEERHQTGKNYSSAPRAETTAY